MSEKQYIRARLDITKTNCRSCGKEIIKNNDKQIVYYCNGCQKDRNENDFKIQ